MEAICFSETSVETQRTARRHIPEDDTLHNHRCENLKSYKILNGQNQILKNMQADARPEMEKIASRNRDRIIVNVPIRPKSNR
jgi:hypothetical protein